jgi:response regulator RpfG family c-di-GMP phosphodiesterase
MPTAPGDSKKPVARVVFLDLDDATSALLREAFRQFNIQAVSLSGDPVPRLRKEKFEGCVLRLDSNAGRVLEALRKSPSNSRIVVFGMADTVQRALAHSKYGINAVFQEPVERQQALKVVRSTHLLVVHELRRYVRLPLVTAVRVQVEGRTLSGRTSEVSAGGMSMELKANLRVPQAVELFFDLPSSKTVSVRANICWVRAESGLIGFRFDAQDERRRAVKEWIEAYLEID